MRDYLKELSAEFNENLKLNYDLKKKNWFNIFDNLDYKPQNEIKNLNELIKLI